MYAAQHPAAVSHLISLNSLYGVAAPWGMAAAFAAPDDPAAFDLAPGAYAWRTGPGLVGAWERSIPVSDPDTWRDPRVAAAYVAAILASDPAGQRREPPAVRSARGFQYDSFLMAQGHQFWSAAAIRAKTLIVRGERDFWSRPVDLETFAAGATNAAAVATATVPDGTHFLFLDRPGRGRDTFLALVRDWLRT